MKTPILSILILCLLPLPAGTSVVVDDGTCIDLMMAIARVDSLREAGRADSAVVLGEVILGRARSAGGEADSVVVRALASLGRAEVAAGLYESANAHLEEGLRRSGGDDAPDRRIVADILHALEMIYAHQGRYEEAVVAVRRSIEIRRRLLGPVHLDVARGLNSLAVVTMRLGRYDEAESLYLETIEVQEHNLGRDDPAMAKSLTNLAVLYRRQGRYHEAERLLKRAVRLTEGIESPDPDLLAWQIDMLAMLYYVEGRYAEAEPLARRSLSIREAAVGPDHPEVALALNGLGLICLDTGRFEEAERLLGRALAIEEAALGPDHPRVASRLNNLGTLYLATGRPERAEPLLRRALEIKEKTLGADNPLLGSSLNNLGTVLMRSGRYAEAEPFIRRGLEVRRNALGADHPQVALSQGTLARLYGLTGRAGDARRAFLREVEIRRDFTVYLFGRASEAQMLQHLREFPPVDGALLSFALEDTTRAVVEAALEMVLHGKAVVIDAMSAEREFAYASYDPAIQASVGRHAEVCGEISTLTLRGPGRMPAAAYRDSLRGLYAAKDSLEADLSAHCAAFRDELASRRFDARDVAAAIPPGAVLWEIIRYEPYDFTHTGARGARVGPARYAGFTLDRTGAVTLTDLGAATAVDSLVVEARRRIEAAPSEVYRGGERESEAALAGITRRLYDLLFRPLLSRSGTARSILVSPDGALALLPLEILVGPGGRYVIEEYTVTYLSTGRDLLRARGRERPAEPLAVVISDPEFGETVVATPTGERGDMGGTATGDVEARAGTGEASGGEWARDASSGPATHLTCAPGPFDPLARSREEGRAIARLIEARGGLRVEWLSGARASEEAVKRQAAPRLLHLATHGFFCPDGGSPPGSGDVSPGGLSTAPLDNPLLRAGLALAGANGRVAGRAADTADARPTEDGILTALEVSGLDLTGTELVVLSACETGMGDVRSGEGVFGLRRAFRLAGAESIVMSLWAVPDRPTSELMERFYEYWLDGRSRSSALRRAELDLLEARRREKGAAHPLFWGGFILAGDPGSG